MKLKDIKIETRELGLDVGNNHNYVFIPICTSDECRLKNKLNKTDIGVVKNVNKTIDFCPDCEYALFWRKEIN